MNTIRFFIKDFEDQMGEVLSFPVHTPTQELVDYIKPHIVDSVYPSISLIVEIIKENLINDLSKAAPKETLYKAFNHIFETTYPNVMIDECALLAHIKQVQCFLKSDVRETTLLPLESEVLHYRNTHVQTYFNVSLMSSIFKDTLKVEFADLYEQISSFEAEIDSIFGNSKLLVPLYFIYE